MGGYYAPPPRPLRVNWIRKTTPQIQILINCEKFVDILIILDTDTLLAKAGDSVDMEEQKEEETKEGGIKGRYKYCSIYS